MEPICDSVKAAIAVAAVKPVTGKTFKGISNEK
jgi:hypothetical protein